MTEIQRTVSLPPFPRLGELYRALAGAIDTKSGDRNVDRAAREGEFDWSLLPTLRQTLIAQPLLKASNGDTAFVNLISQFAEHIHDEYVGLVSTISLDGLSRSEALPLLTANYFGPQCACLLMNLKQISDGPDLLSLLDPEKQPVAVVLEWIERSYADNIAKVAFPGSADSDKHQRTLVSRWRNGDDLPDLQSITLFVRGVTGQGNNTAKWSSDFFRWMVVARALSWFERKSPTPFRTSMRHYLLTGCSPVDIGRIMSYANIRGAERLSALIKPALMLRDRLSGNTPKQPGDKLRTRAELNSLQALFDAHDPEGQSRYFLSWLEGRWHILAGKMDEALTAYKEAVDLCDYRAGALQKEITGEVLALAAYVGGQKPLLKRLKHRAVAFDLFAEPSSSEILEDWETKHFEQQFHRLFPRQGHFPESEVNGEHDQETLPFLLLDPEQFARLEPDLTRPNRIRSVTSATDGQKRRWPQLRLFASVGRVDAVQALLKKGASVDQLDESDGSALLCAIQYAAETGERQVLDLLLDRSHAKDTLNRETQRKRHTPLICAVRYGEPDVVEKLLSMGAEPNQRGQIDQVTPLYRCMASIGALRRPERFHRHMIQSLLADPDHMKREVLRRYNITLGGVFGDELSLRRVFATAGGSEFFELFVSALLKEEMGNLSEAKLLAIVGHLLKAGANPNAPHNYPAPGRTPLMLAAENDSAEAFGLMMQHSGNPYQTDMQGLHCAQIALGFQSRNVIGLMRQIGIL